MKSSHKSAPFIYSAIIFAVMLLLPLVITTLTGANSSGAFNSAASSVHPEANLSATAEPATFFATYTVNSLTDTGAGSGTTGDLRYCITQANAAGGADTINISVTGTITLTSALPNISDSLTINGPGADLLTISGNNAVRVFRTSFSPTVTFSNLTIASGNAASGNFGGGIYHPANSTMNITNCVIRNCSALIGAGVFNEAAGTVNITGSTIRNNSASSSGGGVYNNVGGTLNIIRSTFNNNSAPTGGGIYNNDNSASRINITNSTFSANTVGSGAGAGFYTGAGIHTITNSTFTGNSAGTGGGISRSSATVTVKNSIIAQNTAATGPDLNGTFTSAGYNLIGNNSNVTGFTSGSPNANNDYVGTSGSPINAQLGPLSNYGGPTQTHALLSNSLAIDHGSAATGVTTDQTGTTRPVDNPAIAPATGGNNSDIGAVEMGVFVLVGSNTTYTPAVAPVGAVRINVSTSTNFKGTLVANPVTGVVRITNAHPAGAYGVIVKAFDTIGAVTTSSFTLAVQTPSNTCASPSYTNAADIGTSQNACSVAVADFNKDGLQDLAIATNTGDNVAIRLGNGTGGFTGSTNVPVGPASHPGHGIQPNQVVIGDFNSDGNPDFATANFYTGSVSIRLGDGAGGFTGETATSEITTGVNADATSLAIGDFNGDGKQDLAVANPFSSTVSILLGNGLGAFTVSGNVSIFGPQFVTAGDFNNDGLQDLAVASGSTVAIRLGDGLGGFSGSTSVNVGSQAQAIAIGDFNGDGKQDFATANFGSSTVSIRLGNGTGGFTGSTNVTVGSSPYSVAIGDFNNDGKQDFITANYNSNSSSVVLGNGTGGFGTASSVSVGNKPISVAVGDFNNDNTTDFATANVVSNNASVRLGNCGSNTAPTITAGVGVSRQQGSPASNSQIATVNDTESGASAVTVTVTSANPSNGVTISNIVNTSGNITADIVASCVATNASFTLQASDGSLTATATLSVTVTANTAPTLTYSNQSVAFGGSLNVNPAAATDNGSITGYAIQSVTPPLTTLPTVSAIGIVSITNAQPAGNHVITVRATDNCTTTSDATFTLTVGLAPPTITAAGALTRQQGSAASNSQIATVSDANQAANTLNVTATPLTGTGVTVSGISVDASGNVTANVVASCTATNSTFTLTVTNNQSATATATLTVNVTANTAPVLGNYSTTNINAGSSTTVTPSAAPTDNGTITSLTASAPGFTGTFSGNISTGVITVTNAGPAGSYTVTVTATDNCTTTSTKTFTLNVNALPTINGATISRQQGSAASNSQIATVDDADQTENTLNVTATPLTGTGVTVSGISVDVSGNVTASVAASCTATNSTFTLTVTDNQSATATATLTVNITANTAPTLGNYSTTNMNAGGNTMVTPSAAPTDNGTVTSLTASAPGFTGTFSGNTSTGVITVTNAGPAGSYTVTVTATDNCTTTSTKTFTLNVNALPTINGATISRQQGSAASNSQIATVDDADQTENTLNVTATPLTGTGVTVSGISVDVSGNVTASVAASCTATNSTFTLMVTDNQGATATATLTVNVTANTAPALGNYSTTSVGVGSSTTVTPSVAPTDNGTITDIVASAPGFTGTFSVNTTSGEVTISNAGPVGSYTVTVTATDNCGATSTKTFTLDVACLTYTVNSLGDTGAGTGTTGDLRYCITQANAQPCNTTINFSVTGVINLTSALPALNNNITFNGPGAALLDVHRNSANAFRIFTVNTGKTVAINGLTLSNGNDTSGGAIHNLGSLILTNCTLADNHATFGGALYNEGGATTANISGCTFSNNQAGTGGAIDNFGTLVVTGSTLSGNATAGGTGGAFNSVTGTASFTNCTISGNDSAFPNRGAGIFINNGTVTLLNCTITANGVTANSGISGQNGTLNIKNSIVAGNTGLNLDLEAGITFNNQGNNLLSGDPLLAPLGNYGGATKTHALCNNSPAINAGNNTGAPTTDQRGVSRPVNTTVDIGAFEANITVNPASILAGTQFMLYPNQTFTASGGNAPYTFSLSGTLPTGMSFTGGTLSGTPTETGTFTIVVIATGTDGFAGAMCYTLTINCPVISLSPSTLPNSTLNASYNQTITASGGSAPYTFAVTPGSLPTGLMLSSGGVLSGTPTAGGSFTFTVTATAANGCTGSQVYTVSINTPPTITAVAPLSRERDTSISALQIATVTDPDQQLNTLTVTATPLTGSGVTISSISVDATGKVTATVAVSCTATNSTFTLTVTDAQGVTATATLTVNVTAETKAPLITCPANIIQSTDNNLCSAVVNFTTPQASDNCGSATVVCSPPTGAAFSKGVTTVTCTATDGAGNTTSCSFTVTVNDTQNPTISCPANIVRSNDANQCSVVVTYTNPVASDNCPGTTVICIPESGTAFAVGATLITCRATDASGNTSSSTSRCTFTITVNDTQNPTVSCPANMTVNTTQGSCSAPVSFTVSAADNCAVAGPPACTPPSGSTFPKGTTTVNCSVTDFSNNSGSCSFTVTVNDNQNPTVACPQNITANTAPGTCAATVTYTPPQASDNCPGATVVCVPASGTSFAKGVTTVICTATDQAGLTGTCNFTVTVNDMQAPTLSCPANITRSNDANTCSAVVTYTTPTANDNCSGASVVCSPPSGTAFPKGVTTVTCTVKDASNNSASCNFTVTVNDTQAPSITCPANITTTTDGKQCTVVVNYAAPQTSDNCPGTVNVSCTPPSGSTFTKGVTTVNCTATDTSNNTANCSFTVTVMDITAPSITCPANITKTTDANQCSAVVTFTATASDNCQGSTTSCSPPSGSAFAKGVTTVNCQATDANGNQSAMCSFTVTVNDAQNPALACPANITKATDANQCSAVVNYAVPVATDNCPGLATVTCVPPTGTAFPKGVTTVNCTVRDASQNQSSCSFTVTVNDTQAPVMVTPANMIVSAAKTCPIATSTLVTYAMPTISDNCPGASVVCVPPSGSSLPVGATTVNCTATDASGNTAACSFKVTVYNACVQDDSNSGRVLLWNTVTGEYRFCCDGTVYTGVGTVTIRGCVYMLAHNAPDKRVSGKMDLATFKGDAGMQTPAGSPVCSLIDRDVRDNTCLCQ